MRIALLKYLNNNGLLWNGGLYIGVRIFFLDGKFKDYVIQTYYKNDDTLYTLVLDNGKYEVVDNVSHMIKLV